MDVKEQAYQFVEILYRFGKENGPHKEIKNEDKKHKLRSHDIMFLRSIHMMNYGEPVKMSQLSKYFRISPAAITQVIRRLEDKGLVERIIKDSDRRSVYVKLSESAIQGMKSKDDKMISMVVDLLMYLGEEDTDELLRILKRAEGFMELRHVDCKGEAHD